MESTITAAPAAAEAGIGLVTRTVACLADLAKANPYAAAAALAVATVIGTVGAIAAYQSGSSILSGIRSVAKIS